MEVNFESLCSKYIRNAKIRENGNIYGYIKTEKSFDEFITKLQAIGYEYSTRKSTVYGKSNGNGGKDISPFFSNKRDIDAPIEFCGNPYVLQYSSHRHCSLGPKYYKHKCPDSDEEVPDGCPKKRRFRLMSTKKIGCQAKMVIRRVKVFTEYFLDSADSWGKRAKIIGDLRIALSSSDPPKGLVRYYIEMTPESMHQHPKIMNMDANVAGKKMRKQPKKHMLLPSSAEVQEDVNVAIEANEPELKLELQDNGNSSPPSECGNFVEVVCTPNYKEENVTDDTILVTDDNNTHPCETDSNSGDIEVRSDPVSVRTSGDDTNQYNVQALQSSVRSAVERIVAASYGCENKHVLFEMLTVLKGCTQIMEDHQLL